MIKIEIEGIEDLITFITIIRDPEIDLNKIKELTATLNKSTNTLIDAENKDKGA